MSVVPSYDKTNPNKLRVAADAHTTADKTGSPRQVSYYLTLDERGRPFTAKE